MGKNQRTHSRKLRLVVGASLAGCLAIASAASWPMLVHGFQQGRKSTDPPTMSKGKLGQDLFLAIDHRDLAGVQALLKNGADPDSRNGLELTPLDIAAASHQLDVMKALLAAGAKADAESTYGTPLSFACATAHLEGVQMLLGLGADVNAARTDGMTALMMASNSGHPGVVGELLKAKADVNAVDVNDSSALMLAARGGNEPVVGELIAAGATIDRADLDGQTPLMAAAMTGRANIVGMLLKAGAKVNARDAKGNTALTLAARYGDYPQVLQTLLAAGADMKPQAATFASTRGYAKSATLLGKPVVKPARSVREAIPASLKVLQSSMGEFTKNTNCISCHQEGLGRIATGEARDKGFKLDNSVQEAQLKRIQGALTALKPLHEGALKSPDVMKQLPLIEMNEVTSGDSWLMAGMAAQHDQATDATAAMAMVLARQQAPNGAWTFSLPRVPMQSSVFTFTALSVRALRTYGPASSKQEMTDRVRSAKQWLASTPVQSSEDRASRLLGLKWAGATDAERKASVASIRKDQNPDGGWSQLPGMASDAYATGQALYALHSGGGVVASDTAYKKGVAFLLRTQDPDGSWFVNKRAIPANNYFDAGFPHGQSQYASFNGTCWATLALLQTVGK
jgi:ankyrin repeat protein